MTDTDVTFLSCYNTVGHTRMHVMTLTSPPTLPLSRPWAGLSMRRHAVAPPDSRIATPLILTLLSQRLLDACKKLTPERLHLSFHTSLDLAHAPAS